MESFGRKGCNCNNIISRTAAPLYNCSGDVYKCQWRREVEP